MLTVTLSHSHKLRELSKKDSVLTHTPSLSQCGSTSASISIEIDGVN